ncbi:MAG TPA: hypothetical protein DCX54_06380 [Flavobacteriales bacterium]|nr:hypothetical protein [Flavobacteriales bacterium]
MIVGVVSCPVDKIEQWQQMKSDAIRWLQQKYGTRLRSVVEHIDEEYPHIHFFAVPLKYEMINDIHPGRKASAEVKAAGGSMKEQRASFAEAMRAWQDDFHQSVAAKYGLTRLGPRRQRLTRQQWKAQQNAADSLACVINTIEKQESELTQLSQKIVTETAQLEEKKYDKEIIDDALRNQLKTLEKHKEWLALEEILNNPSKSLPTAATERRLKFLKHWQALMAEKSLRKRIITADPEKSATYKLIDEEGRKLYQIIRNDRRGELQNKLQKLKPYQLIERKRLKAEIKEETLRQKDAASDLEKARRKIESLLGSVADLELKKLRTKLEEKRLKDALSFLKREKEEARKTPENAQPNKAAEKSQVKHDATAEAKCSPTTPPEKPKG